MRAVLMLPLICGAAYGTAITYTTTTTFDPSATVIYRETVGPSSTPANLPASLQESAVGCPALLQSGCMLGSFSNFFGPMILPQGAHLVDAQLQILFFGAGWLDSGLSVDSVVAVDPALPFGPSPNPGSHAGSLRVVFTMAGNTLTRIGDSLGLYMSSPVFDYTNAVRDALATGGQLDPITVQELFTYNFKTAYSAAGGLNSNTYFSETLGLQGGHMDTILTVTYSNPEPSSVVLVVTGMLAVFVLRRFIRSSMSR
jgi:hypothetical protein